MAENFLRRWSRFSLRTLFVLLTALCCYLGWQMSIVRERQALRKTLETNGAYHVVTASEWSRRYPPGYIDPTPLARIPLVRRCLGDEAVQEIGYYTYFGTFSQIDFARLKRAFPEAKFLEDHPPQVPCHPGCFPRGTLVETPAGSKLIETIQPGDMLTAILPGGEIAAATVQSVFSTTNRLWRIETTAGVLLTTEIQPLCLAGGPIIPAGRLQPGQSLGYCRGGELTSVEVLSVAPTERVEPVFNLILGNSELFLANGYLARSKPPRDPDP